jgi:hypothetical protein
MMSAPHDLPDSAVAPSPDRLPPRVNLLVNGISALGFFLVGLSLLLLLTYALFALLTHAANPYVDIIGYLILPSVFIMGLTIVPLGALWKLWRVRRQPGHAAVGIRLPRLDFNDRATRKRLGAFLLLNVIVILPVLAVTSYTGYNYTESSRFCGQTCHTVMEPEATAHANSPHARVSCAECHIGSGASWFVKSKISGARQVLAVALNTYRRPIPPAITELRPARDTCEECHWPAKFFGEQYKELVHFSPDEQNTRRSVRLLLQVGGADESIGRVTGIHMHMLVAGRIDYVASDEILQQIPWVRYTDSAGQVRIFRADGQPADAPPPAGIVRTVDCMDCHNRGAHHFRPPQLAVDQFMEVGRIDPRLPYVKRETVAALLGNYPDNDAADKAIADHITNFYLQTYPELALAKRAEIAQAVSATQTLYHRTVFNAMKVDWRTYPENIGHLISPGCFRCHDGLHRDAAGVPISSECNTCHKFLNAAADDPGTLHVGEFQHSMDLSQHRKLRCNECHNGGQLRLCRDCHADPEWLEKWGKGHFRATTQP